MKYRKLRIAWSVAWVSVCLLVMALWVRSYFYVNNLSFPITGDRMLGFESNRGEVCVYSNNYVSGYYGAAWGREHPWDFRSDDINWYDAPAREAGEFVGLFGLGANWAPPLYLVAAPLWFCALLMTGLAVAPWLRWRFSLRALLIATTLVAIALGLIVFLSSRPASPPLDVGDFPVDVN